ncbi:alpha/beta hydrolase [Microbacteriaceae bacterium VKM Ac-2854]|nr:alpha/beta hydrolase [Microbacteriaceae bacterium VKM Ac-2854]
MTFVDIHGASIHFDEYGDARNPLLILVHGLMGDGTTVAPLARRLAERFHVITPDALGHGRSARPDGFTLADQGAMLNGLVGALGDESAVFGGISMGSYLVAQAATLEPGRARRLVLIVGKAHGLTSSSAAFAASKGVDLSTLAPEEMLALMAEAVWSPDTSPERRAALLGAMNGEQVVLSRAEQAAVERSLAGFDLRPELASITAPTLVISGASDGLNPPERGRELAEHIPGARFEVYQHSGHMLAFEEEDRLVADIEAFAA